MNNRKKVEVCFTPNLYDLHSEDAEIVVVIDVLRATTAMCSAFDNGVAKMCEKNQGQWRVKTVSSETLGHVIEVKR